MKTAEDFKQEIIIKQEIIVSLGEYNKLEISEIDLINQLYDLIQQSKTEAYNDAIDDAIDAMSKEARLMTMQSSLPHVLNNRILTLKK